VGSSLLEKPLLEKDGTTVDFETKFVRFHFEGGRWVAHQRTQARTSEEIWEDGDDFPARSLFP
jgi:hypothetical protein